MEIITQAGWGVFMLSSLKTLPEDNGTLHPDMSVLWFKGDSRPPCAHRCGWKRHKVPLHAPALPVHTLATR